MYTELQMFALIGLAVDGFSGGGGAVMKTI